MDELTLKSRKTQPIVIVGGGAGGLELVVKLGRFFKRHVKK
jgi:NADH dehydrogenase FAD-containing subunit